MKCSWCSANIKPGTGKMFVKKSGEIFYFCSRKCEQHFLRRGIKGKRQKWTKKK